MARGRRWVAWIGAALSLLMIWGVAVEPRLVDVEEEIGVVPDLPPAWIGRRVVLIGDLQVGMWLGNTDTVRRIVRRVLELRPEAVFVAGDFVYDPIEDEREEQIEEVQEARGHIEAVSRMLAPLPAGGIATYAVLGNHDYGMQWPDSRPVRGLAAAVRSGLESVGVAVLHNEAVSLDAPAGAAKAFGASSLYLVGIGPHYAGEDDGGAALAAVPADAPRIVLMHNPRSFDALPAGAAPLALAAHTHGGQVRIPFLPQWSWMSVVRDDVHADGWIRDVGARGNRLYVNRGIGFSLVPVRLNCPPELTLLTLSAGD
jgi:predicted MPP superfamily phosphohydrolase